MLICLAHWDQVCQTRDPPDNFIRLPHRSLSYYRMWAGSEF